MKVRLFAISLIGSMVCGSALADEPEQQPTPPTFSDIDANADMYIDKEEFSQFQAEMREKMRARFAGGPRGGMMGGGKRGGDRFNDADADGDGLLNESEFAAMIESMQKKRDEMRQRWADMRQQD